MNRLIFSFLLIALPWAANAQSYKSASSESLNEAKAQMQNLAGAMKDAEAVLKRGELAKISAHSKYISSLVSAGEQKFGSTIFEPLGSCFAAGLSARTWWNAQLSATQSGGKERIPGSIKDALNEFKERRKDCLEAADPVAVAKAEAELIKKRGEGSECLTVYDMNPETKKVFALPKPAHCKS